MKAKYDPAKRRRANLAAYGITEVQFLKMWHRQRGYCDICAKPLPNERKNIVVDHDHGKSKRVRGLLHRLCNRLIGNNRNTPLMFRNAAAYLESTFDGRNL